MKKMLIRTTRKLTKRTVCTSSSSISTSRPPNQTDDRDRQVFGRLINACKLSLDLYTSRETHTRVVRFGYGTDPSLLSYLVSAYSRCGRHDLSRRVIVQLYSWSSDVVALNLVVSGLVSEGEYAVARKVFDEMPVRDVVSWNAMIAGYVKNARYEEAVALFRGMVKAGFEPDKFTFSSVMTGCARLGAFDRARWVHGLLVESRIELNPILSAALIDMYARCGRIESAREIFRIVDRGEVSVWNTMIHGLAVHGMALDALVLFSEMEKEGVSPDSITFLGILTALSHGGLVNEGRRFFEMMRSGYLIQPEIEHYGAMVDLLGRAGHLEEVYDLILRMPMKPDLVIWRAFLSACRTYRRLDIGEVAIANMSRLGTMDYVLLSNMLCSQAKWEDAGEVREIMKKNGLHKPQGRSWLELGGVVHRFKAGDESHPETEAIYTMLYSLIERTRSEGFVPITDLVMMDISEEEKEANLFLHSEKLALAYGILRTSPQTELRVTMNLRICCDCHNWIKIVSKLLRRVIIIRDRVRFHCFEGGLCSCGDFW